MKLTALALAVATLAGGLRAGETPLFNGTDLTSWVNVNVGPTTFTVKDGMIVCNGVPTGEIRTKRMYENFILELEYRHMKPGGNAGVFIWSDALTAPGQPFIRGIEVQVLDGHNSNVATSHGDVFAIHGATMKPDHPHPGGWMRCLPTERRAKPVGEWNHYRITCNDGSLKLAVNGKVVSGASACKPRKGYICLESEGGIVHFRNLTITELPSTNPRPDEVARIARGFRSLYNGVDFKGWKYEEAHQKHWTAKNWIIDHDGAGTTLRTAKEFEDCELIIDWRWTRKSPKAKHVAILPWRVRNITELPPEIRAAAVSKVKAYRRIGAWNRFHITVKGDRLSVLLNGKTIIEKAQVPGIKPRGPIVLHHRGDPIQFANIFVKPL